MSVIQLDSYRKQKQMAPFQTTSALVELYQAYKNLFLEQEIDRAFLKSELEQDNTIAYNKLAEKYRQLLLLLVEFEDKYNFPYNSKFPS